MPKKPKQLHVLRTLRELYGLSQPKLAALVGCSPMTIKQIEAGTLRPSADLTHRIFTQTQLDPEQLIENSWPELPRSPMGEPLTPESFQLLRRMHRNAQSLGILVASKRHYGEVINLLLDASVPDDKLWALRVAFRAAIERLIADFDLEPAIKELLAKRWASQDLWRELYVKANAPETVNANGAIIPPAQAPKGHPPRKEKKKQPTSPNRTTRAGKSPRT
jgi:transcriptional regulator with XRE-family HTH domain